MFTSCCFNREKKKKNLKRFIEKSDFFFFFCSVPINLPWTMNWLIILSKVSENGLIWQRWHIQSACFFQKQPGIPKIFIFTIIWYNYEKSVIFKVQCGCLLPAAPNYVSLEEEKESKNSLSQACYWKCGVFLMGFGSVRALWTTAAAFLYFLYWLICQLW